MPTSGGGRKAEPEIDKLSNIIKAFNDQFGGLFNDPKAVEKRIIEVIPPKVSADPAFEADGEAAEPSAAGRSSSRVSRCPDVRDGRRLTRLYFLRLLRTRPDNPHAKRKDQTTDHRQPTLAASPASRITSSTRRARASLK